VTEHEQRKEDDVEQEQTIDDLEVPEGQQQDVGGGTYKLSDILVSGDSKK
jgi:hypothetical protein